MIKTNVLCMFPSEDAVTHLCCTGPLAGQEAAQAGTVWKVFMKIQQRRDTSQRAAETSGGEKRAVTCVPKRMNEENFASCWAIWTFTIRLGNSDCIFSSSKSLHLASFSSYTSFKFIFIQKHPKLQGDHD